MTTKRLAKKMRVGHSTLEKMLSTSSLSVKTFKEEKNIYQKTG
jgi:hypothetical protein